MLFCLCSHLSSRPVSKNEICFLRIGVRTPPKNCEIFSYFHKFLLNSVKPFAYNHKRSPEIWVWMILPNFLCGLREGLGLVLSSWQTPIKRGHELGRTTIIHLP